MPYGMVVLHGFYMETMEEKRFRCVKIFCCVHSWCWPPLESFMSDLYSNLKRHDPQHDLHQDDDTWKDSHCHVEFHEFDARELFEKYCGEDGLMAQDDALALMRDMYPGYAGSLEFVCEELFNEQMLCGTGENADVLEFEGFVDFHNDMVEMLGKTGGWTEENGAGDAWTASGKDLDEMKNIRPSTRYRKGAGGGPRISASCGCLDNDGNVIPKSSLEMLNNEWGF